MKKVLMISTIIIVSSHINLFACDCIGEISVKEEIKQSDVVFIGKVINVTDIHFKSNLSGIQYVIKKFDFQISDLYKGKIRSRVISVFTGTGEGDCGFDFNLYNEYIVYGNWENKYYSTGEILPRFLYTDICTLTKLFNNDEKIEIEKYKRRKHSINN